MSWPPEGSKPHSTPRPTPSPRPRPERPSPVSSPGEATGETTVKPQAKSTGPTPPQFGGEGIDPRRAALILGLPLLAITGTLLFLFASTTVWWIAAGVAAAAVAGGVVLRRSKGARTALRRLPGAGRVASALRRTKDGRFSRSPLGRAVNRALGRPSSGGSTGGASPRPKGLGGKLRSMLPSWAGGNRKASSSTRPGGAGGAASGGRPGGRMRSMLSRLKPGGGRGRTTPGGASGGRPGKPGGASQGGARPKPGSLLGRAARSVRKATGKASRAVGSKLFGIRPAAPSGGGKPTGKGKKKPPGGGKPSQSDLDLGIVWRGLGGAGKLLGRGVGVTALTLLAPFRREKKPQVQDDFDPSKTYEAGIDGEVVDGKHLDPELGRIAKRARQEAKKRAKAQPVWPNVDVDEVLPPVQGPQQEWPDYDVDDYAPKTERPPPKRSLPAERRHDPRAKPSSGGDAPLICTGGFVRRNPEPTGTSKHGGKPMAVSPTKYNDLITNANTRQQGWQGAADAFRRDSGELDEKAKEHDEAARIFKATGNHAAAEEREDDARKLRDDARTCMTYAAKMQEKANSEASAA